MSHEDRPAVVVTGISGNLGRTLTKMLHKTERIIGIDRRPFFGKPKDHHAHDHAHESPPAMVVPMALLAVLAVVAGFVAFDGVGEALGFAGGIGQVVFTQVFEELSFYRKGAPTKPDLGKTLLFELRTGIAE